MKDEYIKAFDKTILGVIRTKDNGDQTLLDFPSRKIIGFYLTKDNTTREFSYKIVSQGNTLIALLYKYKGIKM
jgi:hypothetical protein